MGACSWPPHMICTTDVTDQAFSSLWLGQKDVQKQIYGIQVQPFLPCIPVEMNGWIDSTQWSIIFVTPHLTASTVLGHLV